MDPPDMLERQLRLRLLAKEAMLKSIAQDRIARAGRTRQQKHQPGEIKVGDKVDIYHKPERKKARAGVDPASWYT